LKILAVEPYYGGSHQAFLDGLRENAAFEFMLLTLPPRKWKWRMRLAAPYFAEKIISICKQNKIDAVLCSSFVDVATLRSLLPVSANRLPFYTYFHENQFAYPVRREDERDLHFGLTNLTTILASDKVAFNTRYNMQTFLAGVEKMLKKSPDMKFTGIWEKIEAKSIILHPGLDFSKIDEAALRKRKHTDIPVIVWNHRWEHDKNPKYFFKVLYKLDSEGRDFRLIVMGQSFKRKPTVFSEAREILQHRIDHYGFVESRREYAGLLVQGDIVVSTAKHEFYGISVIEAVRAGCMPLLPKRLSYPELFPARYLYERDRLYDKLKSVLANHGKADRNKIRSLSDRFSWTELWPRYKAWLSGSSEPS